MAESLTGLLSTGLEPTGMRYLPPWWTRRAPRGCVEPREREQLGAALPLLQGADKVHILQDANGDKIRKMLGRAKGAAIKLDSHEDVASGLHVGEGIETCLSARQLGYRPTWAVGSAGEIERFPVLAGIEAITVFAENDRASNRAAMACGKEYIATGCEAWVCRPPFGDLNETIRRPA